MTKNQKCEIQIDADEMKVIDEALEMYHTENLKIYKKTKEEKPWDYEYINYLKNKTKKEMMLIEKWNNLVREILDKTD